jgi:hypothetical protein
LICASSVVKLRRKNNTRCQRKSEQVEPVRTEQNILIFCDQRGIQVVCNVL